jgi:hypothetical protein
VDRRRRPQPTVTLFLLGALLTPVSLAGCGSGSGGGGDPPVISSFTATPTTFAVGNRSNLAWSATGATTLSIDQGVGTVNGYASAYVNPAWTTTYKLTATGPGGSTTASLTVTVTGVSTCTPPTPQSSALPAAQVLETRTFEVPARTASVTILQQGTQPAVAKTWTVNGETQPNVVVPLSVSVAGTTYYDDAVKPPNNNPQAMPIYYSGLGAWTGAMTIPNTSNMLGYVSRNGGVPSGTWTVVVNDKAASCVRDPASGCVVANGTTSVEPGTYDLKALLKPGPLGSKGTMDVGFYLVTETLNATTAASDPSVKRMLQTLVALFDRGGITLGTPTFIDVAQSVKSRYSTGVKTGDESVCGETATILSMAKPGRTMNLFLVNGITAPAGTGTYLGLAGGIPGATSVGGTGASGALVSLENLKQGADTPDCSGAINFNCGADDTAYTAIHESGHVLGLFHTTEKDGNWFDPVADTPTCACSACAPETQRANCSTARPAPATPYDMQTGDCPPPGPGPGSCGGGSNLMFWVSGKTSDGALTAEQSNIIRANPLIGP